MFEPFEPRDVRVQLLLTESEASAIDAFRNETGIRTRNEAIRSLLKAGLDTWQDGKKTKK
jgi:metal-responsive CopG/Arc/MetJ family transcriptional regulator